MQYSIIIFSVIMMETMENELKQFALDFRLPRYAELPDMGLYLEQLTNYVNRYVASPLTSSMVSNYVKSKTIPGPKGKTYGPDSIAYLIYVSYFKSVACMEDIRLLMGIQRSSYDLPVAYDYFCGELENLVQYVFGLKAAPDFVGHEPTKQKELLRSALFSVAYKIHLDKNLELLRSGSAG